MTLRTVTKQAMFVEGLSPRAPVIHERISGRHPLDPGEVALFGERGECNAAWRTDVARRPHMFNFLGYHLLSGKIRLAA